MTTNELRDKHVIDQFDVDLTAIRERELMVYRALMHEEGEAFERLESLDDTSDDIDQQATWLAANASYLAIRALVEEHRARAIAAEVAELEAGGTTPNLTMGQWN